MKMPSILLAAFTPVLAARGAAAGQAAAQPVQATEQSSAIHGVVLNAKTGQPLGRVLVQVEGNSQLTGFDGKFSFSALNGTMATLRIKKPGFYAGLDPYETGTKQVPVGSADDVEVRLYPEALITGTVSEANGDPLPGVQVQALRRNYDEAGPRWNSNGWQTSTNADGEFRLPLPAGEYVVQTQYMANRPGGHGAILPVLMPTGAHGGTESTTNQASTIRLASGTEQHLELHPAVRPAHTVHVTVDSAAGPGPEARAEDFAPQIQAHLANGLEFSPAQSRGERQGEVSVSLPNGSYLLSASTGFRDEAASYGETRVTVADEDVAGVTIHLQKALELTVEASLDPAATAAGLSVISFVQQLGIFLQRMDTGVGLRADNVSATSRHGGPVAFTLLPGTYRLRSQGSSQWYVESATAGGTDLLSQDLVVDGGSSSLPLRLVVSNQVASIQGTTKLRGQAAECYISLLATTPSASPLISARSAADGSFTRGQVPPGSYTVVASESRMNIDLSDPEVRKQIAPYLRTVTLGAGETERLDLDAMPAAEMTP